jgi:hypothetical protein
MRKGAEFSAGVTSISLRMAIIAHSIKPMKTAQKFTTYLELLDKHHWLRIVVFLTPGALAKKIVGSFAAPSALQLSASLLLGAGLALYIGWGFLRKKLWPDLAQEGIPEHAVDAEAQPSAPVAAAVVVTKKTAVSHASMMLQLVSMCDGDASIALSLVHDECEVDPDASYTAAIESAHRRKSIQIKRLSGN